MEDKAQPKRKLGVLGEQPVPKQARVDDCDSVQHHPNQPRSDQHRSSQHNSSDQRQQQHPNQHQSGQPQSGQHQPDQIRSDQRQPGQHHFDQHEPYQHHPNQTHSDQHQLDQIRSDQHQLNQHHPNQHHFDKHKPDQLQPDQTTSDLHQPDQHHSGRHHSDDGSDDSGDDNDNAAFAQEVFPHRPAAPAVKYSGLTAREQPESAGGAERDVEHDDYERCTVFTHKCVGVRYYSGLATVGEQVVARRELHHPHSHHAMRIEDVHGQTIGHVPSSVAARLAPLLDARLAAVEVTVAGPKGPYDMPVRYDVLCRASPDAERTAAIAAIRNARLPGAKLVDGFKQRQRVRRAAAAVPKPRSTTVAAAPRAGADADAGPGGDDLEANRDPGKLVQQFGVSEADLQRMDRASQPTRLATRLLPHQLKVSTPCPSHVGL